MTDTIQLESGLGDYLLEDGSGVLLIDQRVEVKSSTIQISESKDPEFDLYLIEDGTGAIKLESGLGYYKQDVPIYHSADTVDLSETVNRVRALKKEINDIIGLTESKNRLRSQVRNID